MRDRWMRHALIAGGLVLAGTGFAPTPIAAQTATDDAERVVVNELFWVPVRTAEGVYGEDFTMPSETATGGAADAHTFDRLDADGDGTLSRTEWMDTTRDNEMADPLAGSYFAAIDDDDDGRIDRPEFNEIGLDDFADATMTLGDARGDMPEVIYVPMVFQRVYQG